jgi:hypothetical protein
LKIKVITAVDALTLWSMPARSSSALTDYIPALHPET